jgi:outer membrane autotransporter protein
MNSTFKVVFNKARGALMVVNEVTSSVQAKGTKTVVAAAVATMIAGVAGTAMAAEWEVAPEGLEAATDTVITDANWAAIKDQNAFELTSSDKEAKKSWASVAKDQTFDKTLWVSGAGAKAHASGFGVSGEKVKFTNKGTIYVTSGKDGVNYQNDAIWAGNGATAINEGKIVAKDAYGMRVGTGDTASKIVNNGSIYVESTGAGMELGGAANSEAVNNGLISVGDVNTESKQAEFGHGVLIQDQTGAKFTNNGTITAGKGASAIEVKGNVNNTALNFGAKSDVNGLVHLAAGTTTLTFDATVDTMKIKTEQQKDKATVAAHLVLKNNANITLEDGQKSTYETVTLDDSRLNASIWGADNTFKTVTVNEGSIFNITKLNSRVDLKSDADLPKDQLLIARDQSFTYDHAQMHVAGKVFTGNLKVGTLDQKGTVTLKGGEHNFSKLTVGAKESAFNLGEKAVVTVGGLHLYHGEGTAGKVVVNDSTLINTGALTFEPIADKYTAAGTLKLENGTFQTAATDFFKKKEAAAQPEYEATGNQAFLAGNGTLNLTSKAFEYSLADLNAAQNLIDNNRSIKVVFTNGTLTLKEGETLDAKSISGLNLAGHTGVSSAETTGTFAVQQTTTIGAIDFNAVKDKEAKGITLDNAAALTLAGNGGDVFKNLGAKVTTVTTGDLVLGTAGNSGNVNVENLAANTLTVVGAFDAENVSFTADSSIKEGALLDVAKLTSEQNKMAVAGTLVADVIDANVTVDESGVLVLGERQLAPTKRALLAATPAAPEFVDQIQKVVTANNAGALVTTNMQGQALFAAAAGDRFDAEKNVGLYVDHTIGVDDTTGKLIVGNPIDDKGNGTVAIAKDAVVVIDTKKFGAEDTVFDAKLYLSGDAPVILSGLTTNTSFILATETGSGDAKPGINLIDNNVFFKGDLNKAENGSLIVSTVFNDKVTDDAELNDVIKTQLDGSHNQKNADVLAAIADTTKKAGLVNKEGTALTDKGVQAVEEYLVAPLTAGALNLAYDATAQVNAVVENRVLEKADGVWADVFYASNKDSERYGDFGYSADITGGTLGVDTTVSCGAKIGAAFTIGQGDADSEGTVHGYSTDADFYGISLYAGRNVADTSLRISGNLSYLMFENDIKGSVAGASADESLDGKAFTAGLRADWTAYEGAFTVAPHAGLRYTFLEMDDYRDLEIGDMNVVEMPFGVKVSGAFEPAAGWTLQPSVDFTVVPQLGDKDVDTVLGSVDVIDNLYNTELGVEAATGNFSFGLSYKYGFGKEDRKNQSLNLNARYMF